MIEDILEKVALHKKEGKACFARDTRVAKP